MLLVFAPFIFSFLCMSLIFGGFLSFPGWRFCLIQQRHHPPITHEMLRDSETCRSQSNLILSRIQESERVGRGIEKKAKNVEIIVKGIQEYKKRRAVVSTRKKKKRKTNGRDSAPFFFSPLLSFDYYGQTTRRPIIKHTHKEKKKTAVCVPAQLLV